MLDIKFVREHLDEVKQMLANRHNPLNLDDFSSLEQERRSLLQQTETLKQSILDAINEIAGIPSQSNGRTGDSSNNGAVILRNGWQGAETRAQDYEQMFGEPEQKFLEIVCDICDRLSDLRLDPFDIEPKFTRRNYEDLLTKSQTLTTMLGNEKIHPQCAYEACGLFVDTQEAYNMGMDWYEEHGEQQSNDKTPVEVEV